MSKFHTLDTETKQYKTIYDAIELAQAVTDTIQYYQQQNQQLIEKNTKLHDDAVEIVRNEFIDKIQYLEEERKMSYGHFSSQKEKDAYHDFEKRHMHDRMTSRANGGKCPYIIPTGAGIGTILKVVCPICGEQEDITDIEVW